MAKNKITQNINKDAGLMDLPKVKVDHSQWESKHSNYLSCNIGDIVPIYCEEVLPDSKRRITMGQLSHMTTPYAPIFNSQYTEFRCWFVPHRLSADLLAGYKTRKSPYVKVFGEDNASASAQIVVPLAQQTLPTVNTALRGDFINNLEPFGGVADSLDADIESNGSSLFSELNFLDFAAYELIYQKGYRNQNRESATESKLYKWLFDLYNRSNSNNVSYYGADAFHKANREKDYFTGSQPFTQKGDPVSVGLVGEANLVAAQNGLYDIKKSDGTSYTLKLASGADSDVGSTLGISTGNSVATDGGSSFSPQTLGQISKINLKADLSSATGVDIEQLRIMIKTQEMLEKDMQFGNDFASFMNAHFGTAPISLVLDEPLELKKFIVSSQMQPIFQTSSTTGESTILGTIGANATTQSGEFEICPLTEFKEYGYLMICAVHKAQNSYDARLYKPKRIFKKARFDWYVPELNDLGYQPVQRKEFSYLNKVSSYDEAVSYNEAWAEYRYRFNKVHGMFEPSRANSLSYWTLSVSGVSDVQSLYKQSTTELDRAISVTSATAPQFFDAYGFIEYHDEPMSLHSIPGMDGVI